MTGYADPPHDEYSEGCLEDKSHACGVDGALIAITTDVHTEACL